MQGRYCQQGYAAECVTALHDSRFVIEMIITVQCFHSKRTAMPSNVGNFRPAEAESHQDSMLNHTFSSQLLSGFCKPPQTLASFAEVEWPARRWPVYVFLGGAMICLLTSSICHLLGCCAAHINLVVWRFDYVGIAVLIVASFFPPVGSHSPSRETASISSICCARSHKLTSLRHWNCIQTWLEACQNVLPFA